MATVKSMQIEVAMKSTAKLQEQINNLTKRFNNMEKALKSAEVQMKKAGFVLNKTGNAFVKNGKKANKFGIELNATSKSLGGLLVKLPLAATAMLGFGVAAGAIAQKTVGIAVSFQNMQASLLASTGSVRSASAVFSEAAGIAQEYGLSLEATVTSLGSFLAATKGSAIQGKQSIEIFEAVSQAARVYGLSQEELQGTLKALSQISSKGNVQMEELRNQLGDRLPGALTVAAKAMGKTKAELFKMVEQGQLASDEFLPKFAEALRDATAAGAETAKNTPAAVFQRFNNTVTLLANNIGTLLLPIITKLADKLNLGITKLREFLFNDFSGNTLEQLQDDFNNAEMALSNFGVKTPEEASAKLAEMKQKLDELSSSINKRGDQKRVRELRDDILQLQSATDEYIATDKRLSDRENGLDGMASGADDFGRTVTTALDKATTAAGKYSMTYNKQLTKSKEVQNQVLNALEADLKRFQDKKQELEGIGEDDERYTNAQAQLANLQDLIDSAGNKRLALTKYFENEQAEIVAKGKKQALQKDREHFKAQFEIAKTASDKVKEVIGSAAFSNFFQMDTGADFSGADDVGELQNQFSLRMDAINSFYDEKEQRLKQSAEFEKMTETQKNQSLMALQQEHWAAMDEAESERKERKAEIDEQTLSNLQGFIGQQLGLEKKSQDQLLKWDDFKSKQKVKTSISTAAALLSTAGQYSKKAFKMAKVASIANAVINTYEGVSKSLSAYPMPFAGVAAAASLAAGLAQVNAIKSQTFSGGGGGAVSTGGLGAGSLSNNSAVAETTGLAQRREEETGERTTIQEVSVFANGKIFDRETVVEIIEGINEAVGDNVELRVA